MAKRGIAFGMAIAVGIAVTMCSESAAGARTASPVATVTGASFTIETQVRDFVHSAASSAVYAAPDGLGALALSDMPRVIKNADIIATQNTLSSYQSSEVRAFARVYLVVMTGWFMYTPPLSSAASDLWNRLYFSPAAVSQLKNAAAALVQSTRGVPNVDVPQVTEALGNNLQALGLGNSSPAAPASGPLVAPAPTPSAISPPSIPATPTPSSSPPSSPAAMPPTCFGSVPSIVGTEGNDTLEGTNGPDVIVGRGGRDTIVGLGGDDLICAGTGVDTVDGSAGDDRVDGGSDNDVLAGGPGEDQLFAQDGDDVLDGGDGHDYLNGAAGRDNLAGGAGDDWMTGGAGDDSIGGGSGNDAARGEAGRDTIGGEDGSDAIDGEADADVLDGGAGYDEISGGPGRDSISGQADADAIDGGPDGDAIDAGSGSDSCVNDTADATSSCENLAQQSAPQLGSAPIGGSVIVAPASMQVAGDAGWVRHEDGTSQWITSACRASLASRGVKTLTASLAEIDRLPVAAQPRACNAIFPVGPSNSATIGPAGGIVRGPDGVVLTVPAGDLSKPALARITSLDDGYDVHIAGPWTGSVGVAFPIGNLPTGGMPVIGHLTTGPSLDFETSAIIGDNTIATRVTSLSFMTILKCLPNGNPLKILACVGKKEVAKQVTSKAGKKATDGLACGDVSDVFGTLFGDEPCKAGESETEIRRAQEIYAQQHRPTTPSGGGTGGAGGGQSGGGQPGPPASGVGLMQGAAAPYGYRYAISLSGFAAYASVRITCHDSVSPGGFYAFSISTDGGGRAFTSSYCYSADGPRHWIMANGRQSNYVDW